MNSLFVMLGIESWKPVLAALLLPPVPFLLLTLIGARLLLPRRGLGWLLIFISVVLLWLSASSGAARGLGQFLLQPPAAMSFDRVRELRADVAARKQIAIVILGSGVEPFAPEYGVSSLQYPSLERLRYGLWLARETGAPVAFSGGVGWGQPDAAPEAKVAAKIAAEEFNRPIKWQEEDSRDTRENAARTLALLKPAGIDHIVLVTHGYHMPRALRAFNEAAGPAGIKVEAAPMGLARRLESPALEWLPSSRGFSQMRQTLRELAGKLAGA
ncbi:MAG: YdcF family protein [Burkholderiales bacterium]|nr:YdcF family protein [Burkholderiales bacterium]